MKILYIVPTLGYGGIATVVMEYYRYVSNYNISIDFITHGKKEAYHNDIIKMGSEIYYIKTIKKVGLINYLRQIINIYQDNDYSIIHLHTEYLSGITAAILKFKGYKGSIISHVHSTKINNKLIIKFKSLLSYLIVKNSDLLVACSMEAGNYYFGENNRFTTLKNPVDYKKYIHKNLDVCELKKELGVPTDKKIIGHVGSFVKVKNHNFILELFKEISSSVDDYLLVLVGDGILKNEIVRKIESEGLEDKVLLLGNRNDVNKLYAIFDYFLFPSFNEGFGLAVAEAQASKNYCFVSGSIPKICDIGLNLVEFIDLEEPIEVWKNQIIGHVSQGRESISDHQIINSFEEKGFNKEYICNELLKIYRNLVK